jgi:phenylalanyl-tRNA synthetase beta chain
MKISYKWLSQYLDLTNLTVNDVANRITMAGIEVESVTPLAQASNLVIGFVKEAKKHPDSNHLSVCQVDVGGQVSQIICGASNVASGQKVIVALPGAYLPAKGITITKTSIRGQESNGMICSLKELGVDDKFLSEVQKDGIEVLDQNAPLGDKNPLSFLGLDDTILELKPTPNRGDVLSFYSFVLEASAILNVALKKALPNVELKSLVKSNYTVKSETATCPRFAIKAVSKIKVKPSPKWLKELLQASGVRSINNVVDIGNYVMLLTGQPLHIYDADKLAKKEFNVVDNLKTKLMALDDQEYQLEVGDIIITSNQQAVGIGGIMGGKSTIVDEKTINLAIEAASFKDVTIRKTSKRLDLVSDASTRFVRGIDSQRSLYALDLAASLLIELADAKEIAETAKFGDYEYVSVAINLPLSKLNNFLGIIVKPEEVIAILNRLKFGYKLDGDIFKVTIPSYRRDIKIAEDLIEEIIRLLGFDRLASTNPATTSQAGYNDYQIRRNLVRQHLLNNGLDEALSYTLDATKTVNDFQLLSNVVNAKALTLLSPITEDRAYLRTSLIPSLLKSVRHNINYSTYDIALFEMSKIYTTNGEQEHLGLVLNGAFKGTKWLTPKPADFYTIKGLTISLLTLLGIEETRYTITKVETTNKYLHPGRSFYLTIGKEIFGFVGQIHPLMSQKYDLEEALVAEVNLGYLLSLKTSKTKFATPTPFPFISRDIAVIVEQGVASNDLIKLIKKVGKSYVKSAEVFDVYQGPNLTVNQKSIAISIVYQDATKTMTEDEVKKIHAEIITQLELNYQIKLRS